MILPDEDSARAWLTESFPSVSRETLQRLDAFTALLRAEAERQNLVSRSTFDHLYLRHLTDSAQLIRLAPSQQGSWIDLGSGAGFPGLIVAALSEHRVTLVESRRLRVEFLQRAVSVLGVEDRVTIIHSQLERVPPHTCDIISARAFAPLDKLLTLAHPFSTEKTVWILPKGRSAQTELESAESSWQGEFRLEPSLTDAGAGIIVAHGVRPRPQRKA